MGLLPIRTVFEPEKHQVRSHGRIAPVEGPLGALSGAQVEGYEIHMGTTELLDGAAVCELSGEDGAVSLDGCWKDNVYGSYLHGIFDTKECATALASALFEAKGLDASAVHAVDMKAYKEEQYDKLAQAMRDNMDMELVYRIIEEGI